MVTFGARELFLRASVFYAASYHPLYGNPVDSRLLGMSANTAVDPIYK